MKKNKKLFSIILGTVMAGSVVGIGNITKNASAEKAGVVLSAEDYTSSDNLLQANGIPSGKKIQAFSDEVKNALAGADCSEITQVVPRQYMEATETNAIYQYNGKEYGFYMVKEGDYFDLLLIDFVYEFNDENDHNNEYKIRIEPLLQQSFLRQSTSDGYIWTKYCSDTRYTYYVANPRFATGLLNENDLNYGDGDYSKKDDNGLIIQQTRLNYGKISYKTEKDYLALKAEFLGTKALDCVVDSFVDFLDLYTFGIAGKIKDLWDDAMDVVEHEIDMYEQGKEVTILADNEKNIFTNLSRQDQYDNPSIKGYSRAAYFMPNEDEELILSEADDSYAEFIVVLNDTNQSSRLVQICDFEIVRRQGDWSSMQYVDGPNVDDVDNAFTFYKERHLFEKTFSMHKNIMPYYLLANGRKTFKFIPKYSGRYNIKSNNSLVNIIIDNVLYGNAIMEMELVEGRTYNIAFTSIQKAIGIGDIEVSTSNDGVLIDAGKNFVKKFIPASTGVYAITAQGAKITVCTDIFGSNTLTAEENNGELLVFLQVGVDYYFVIRNISTESITTEILVTNAELISLKNNEISMLSCKAHVSAYCQFDVVEEGKYDFVFYGDNAYSVRFIIASTNGQEIAFDRGTGDDCTLLTTETLSTGVYYIHIKSTADIEISCIVNHNSTSYAWKINGITYTGGGLRRGATYKIELVNEYGDVLKDRIFMIEQTYSQFAVLEKTDTGYTLKINDDAKIFNDNLTYYCTIYVKDNQNINISFPVIFQYDNLNLVGVSLDEFDEIPKIKFNDPTNGSETAKLYCTYNFDGGATIEYCIDIGMSSDYNMTKIKNFNQTYFNIMDFTIEYIEIYQSNTIIGKVYNRALSKYSGKINNTYIEVIDIGIHFESGIGSTADPFIINNYLQFEHIDYAIKNGELNYSFLIKRAHFWGAHTIPMFDCTLNGTFDGNNYRITQDSHDVLKTGDKALFQTIGNTGIVQNLILTTSYSKGVGTNNSIAVVAIENYGEIKDSKFIAYFDSSETGMYVGGVVAKNYGRIINCEVDGVIEGGKYFGGIAGYNTQTISLCKFSGSMFYMNRHSDNDYIGGIVGYFEKGLVSNCSFSGSIKIIEKDWESRSYQPYVAGIAGWKGTNGFLTANSYPGTVDVTNLNPDVSWWAWFKTHHFNQQGNVSELANF